MGSNGMHSKLQFADFQSKLLVHVMCTWLRYRSGDKRRLCGKRLAEIRPRQR